MLLSFEYGATLLVENCFRLGLLLTGAIFDTPWLCQYKLTYSKVSFYKEAAFFDVEWLIIERACYS